MGAKNFDIFTGSANPDLASDVSKILGMDISHADVGQFSDGEIKVQIEDNVRGHDTFIIQSTCAPTNKNVMEIMLIANVRRNIKIKEEKHNFIVFANSVNLVIKVYISKTSVFVAVENKVVFYKISEYTKKIFHCQLN